MSKENSNADTDNPDISNYSDCSNYHFGSDEDILFTPECYEYEEHKRVKYNGKGGIDNVLGAVLIGFAGTPFGMAVIGACALTYVGIEAHKYISGTGYSDKMRKSFDDRMIRQLSESEMKARLYKDQIDRPVKKFKEKMKRFGKMARPVVLDKILLLGVKGAGKSTFKYLLTGNDKPIPDQIDGTKTLRYDANTIDTIGLVNGEVDEIMKLFALLCHKGLPKDIIVFPQSDRTHIFTNLVRIGLIQPMFTSINNSVWTHLNGSNGRFGVIEPIRTTVVSNKVKIEEADMNKIYNVQSIDFIEKNGIGKFVTHDDFDNVVSDRDERFMEIFLDNVFTDGMIHESDNYIRMSLYKYMYLWRFKYSMMNSDDNELKFMMCNTTEFDD